MAIVDIRNKAQRFYHEEKAWWMTSSPILPAHAGSEILLFSFPAAYGNKAVLVHNICVDIITAWDGSASMTVGTGTIPLNSTSTGGTLTVTDADDYLASTDITEATIGVYFPAATDFVTAKAAATTVFPVKIVCADATVPVIYMACSASSPTVGVAKVHVQISAIRMD